MPNRSIAPALLIGFSLAVSACSPITATRGNLLDDERLERVTVGQSTKDDVVSALGSPSVVSTFDNDQWYYVGRSTERLAFFKPSVAEQRIYEVRFDKEGRLATLNQVDPEKSQDINPVARETPTGGRGLGFFEQIFGNFGGL